MNKLFYVLFGWLWLTYSAAANTSGETNDRPLDRAANCVETAFEQEGRSATEIVRRQRELFREHEGKKIGEIVFKNYNVFDETDEAENNRLYLFLNKLHIHTREEVVASQLLFQSGDPIVASDITESERILRRRHYLANAYIIPHEICEDSVNITVYTQDAWTTEPQISLSHSGGETSSGFALSEGNVLGTGSSVAIGYEKDADRSGISYYFSSPHLLNSRLAATIGYSDNSDGEDTLVDIAYPFYSLKTPQAYGVRSAKLTQVESIREQGEIINQYRHRIENHEIYFGRGLNTAAGNVHRVLLGITNEKDEFEELAETVGAVPRNTDFAYPWLEYQFLENKFAVYHNIDQIQRTEDIATGIELGLRVGYGSESLTDTGHITHISGLFTDVWTMNDKHIIRLFTHLDSYRHSQAENIDSTIVGAEMTHYLLQDFNNRLYTRLRYDVGKDLADHEKLTVGGNEGVRGYPLDFQKGNRRYSFSLEKRYFSNLHLFNLVRVGGVVFFDAGRAWDRENRTEHLSNVGVGLRISSTKARIGHIVHLDVAFPLADKANADSVQFLVKAEQRF